MENQPADQANQQQFTPVQTPPPITSAVPLQQVVPNSTTILVLGILSIVFCWCYGIIGLTLGIISLALSGKAKEIYMQNPATYTTTSFNNLKAGKICAIIGVCLSGLYILFIIIYLMFIGTMLSTMPWEQLIKGT